MMNLGNRARVGLRVATAAMGRMVLLFAMLDLSSRVIFGASALRLPNVTVGQNLESEAVVNLDTEAPPEGLLINLTSSDPSRMLLSSAFDSAGSPSITLRVSSGRRVSPEFYLQGLAGAGSVTYTASAPGYANANGTVTLSPAGIVIAGPAKFGNPILTTAGIWPTVVTVYAAQLDSAGNFVAPKQLRGGFSVDVSVVSSNMEVGTIRSPLTIAGGTYSAKTEFQPRSVGEITLSAAAPPGFRQPVQFASLKTTVVVPKLGVTEQIFIGANLEIPGSVLLGAPAPEGGVTVTLISNDPSRLLISNSATEQGSKSLTIKIPGAGTHGEYYLQALSDSGSVTYTAEAPGYASRVGTLTLVPSGVILAGPTGTPDEAEYLRPEVPVGPHGFFGSLSPRKPVPISVYTVFLDPKTRRGADITVQAVRAGMSLTVELKNSDPTVGTIPGSVVILGGHEQGGAQFDPLTVGTTVLSVVTPVGFTAASNSTTLTAVIRP